MNFTLHIQQIGKEEKGKGKAEIQKYQQEQCSHEGQCWRLRSSLEKVVTLSSVDLSKKGKFLAIGFSYIIQLYRNYNFRLVDQCKLKSSKEIVKLLFAKDDQFLVAGQLDSIKILNLNKHLAVIRIMKLHYKLESDYDYVLIYVRTVSINNDSSQIAIWNKLIEIWDVAQNKIVQCIEGGDYQANAISKNCQYFAILRDNKMHLIRNSINSLNYMVSWKLQKTSFEQIAFTSDLKLLLGLSKKYNELHIWNISELEQQRTIPLKIIQFLDLKGFSQMFESDELIIRLGHSQYFIFDSKDFNLLQFLEINQEDVNQYKINNMKQRIPIIEKKQLLYNIKKSIIKSCILRTDNKQCVLIRDHSIFIFKLMENKDYKENI